MYVPPKGAVLQPAINYAVPVAAGQPADRKIPRGTALSWVFPKVCPINAKNYITDPNAEVFKIAEIQNALRALKMRFVWWDWACFPQGWNWDWRPDTATGRGLAVGPQFDVHEELRAAAASSMNKMRYFYPKSTVGCLWWHETTWTQGGNPALIGNVESIVQILTAVGTVKNLTLGTVTALVDVLTKATRKESSLVSLWSFQEAVLLTSTARPLPAASTTPASSLGSPSVVLDKNAARYVIGDEHDNLGRAFFQHGQLNLEDIVNAVTTVAMVIGSSLMKYCEFFHGTPYFDENLIANSYIKARRKFSADELVPGPRPRCRGSRITFPAY